MTVFFGALAGGLTNAVAISMLFHPYEPRGPWRLKIQGAIPKNKARLARTIGRTVGQRLLTAQDLTSQLSAPGVREAFDRAVSHFVTHLLETERGALRDELKPTLVAELETVLDAVAAAVSARVDEFVATDAFQEAVERFLVRTHEQFADRPVGDLLTAARQEVIRERVEHWVGDAVASDELDGTIGGWLDRQIERLSTDETPLLDRLPPDLVSAVEREMTGYLPVALERLSAILSDPDARARIQSALHELFQRFIQELLLHERIVARLVVTEKTIARILDNVERDGVDQLAALLDEPEMRTQVARSINDAMVNFLRRPLKDHFDRLGPERVTGIRNTLTRNITAALRDPTTRAHAIEQLDRAMQAAEQRTWGDLLQRLPPERAAAWVADLARQPKLAEWLAEGASTALRKTLDRPIGRPADWLPEGTVDRLGRQLSPVLWDWIQEQVPEVVAQVDIQTMVEQKVLGFSLERIEEIARNTTQRELNLIVRLGYVLGAVVGTVAYVISLILP